MTSKDRTTKPSESAGNATRRDFLKASAGTTAALLASGQYAFAAPSGTLRVGLIGCGGRGTGAALNALSTKSGPIKLVAMADVFPDRLSSSHKTISRDAAKKVEVPDDRKFIGFDAYQKAIDSGADVIILATPPGFRPQHFEACLDAGKHVFMEKPMAISVAQADRILDAEKRSGARLMVAYMKRY